VGGGGGGWGSFYFGGFLFFGFFFVCFVFVVFLFFFLFFCFFLCYFFGFFVVLFFFFFFVCFSSPSSSPRDRAPGWQAACLTYRYVFDPKKNAHSVPGGDEVRKEKTLPCRPFFSGGADRGCDGQSSFQHEGLERSSAVITGYSNPDAHRRATWA